MKDETIKQELQPDSSCQTIGLALTDGSCAGRWSQG